MTARISRGLAGIIDCSTLPDTRSPARPQAPVRCLEDELLPAVSLPSGTVAAGTNGWVRALECLRRIGRPARAEEVAASAGCSRSHALHLLGVLVRMRRAVRVGEPGNPHDVTWRVA